MIRLVKYALEATFFHPEIDIMVDWLNDPENVRYSEQRHKHHRYETQFAYFSNGPDIFRKIYTDEQFIGTIAAYTDRNNSVAYVGILIGKAWWGKGYGYEAWSTFCDHLLDHGIRKIEAGAMANNFGMVKIFRKYDMTCEGVRYQHFLNGSELIDMVQYGKTK